MPGYDMARNDPFAAVAARQKKVEQLAKTASTASGTETGQSMAKIYAMLDKLQQHQEELEQHQEELEQQQTSIQAQQDKLTNAALVSYDAFTDTRNAGDSNWWGGSKPTVSLQSLSGRFMVTYGGVQNTDPSVAVSLQSLVSFAGDGGDRADRGRFTATLAVIGAERTMVLTKDPGSTLTLTLEWTTQLVSGWILLRTLL